jgi:cytochrome c oxidase subunit III
MIEWFFITYAMGAIFVAGQVYEYAALVSYGVALTLTPMAQRFTSLLVSTACT